jgi:Asp-tRNA(Asn)/Glu-tRNA(Gln) amidotransferase C subunit
VESFLTLLLYPLMKLWDGLQTVRGRWPTERRLRALAASPRAQAARAAELGRIRQLVEALGAVEGVEHVLTRVLDSRTRPRPLELLDRLSDAEALLNCRLHARAYFVIREDITAVLPRIEAAGLAAWGRADQRPSAGGTVEHALRWYRDGGTTEEGWAMDSPSLFSPVARLHWDLPGVLRPDPLPLSAPAHPRHVMEQTPPEPTAADLLREARADGRGLVLELVLGTNGNDRRQYHVVPRGGFLGRGRL